MNPERAAGFTHRAGTGLTVIPDWPKLPPHIRLAKVSGIAVDSRGRTYIAHRGENPLVRLHADGSFDCEIGAEIQRKSIGYDLRGDVPVAMERRHWLHGVHVDPWDNLWVTDVGRHLVWRFDPAGRLTLVLGEDGVTGCDAGHFYQPTHVCVMKSGEFFVADGYGNSRVAKFSREGEFLLEWGRRGVAAGEFHTPHAVTCDPEGLLYVTDRENDRVLVFDEFGGQRAEWPGLHSLDGLHYARDGFLYGAAGLDNALVRFDRAGKVRDVWAEAGRYCYPHGIFADGRGAVYVAEIAGNRALRLAAGTAD
jgi:DNA-binding beta-propeller fold protein YncE